ncbi:MAG: succinate dehydrogenase, hydrophobic membrane anchor protein [Pseudomonadales bacterium]|jgi:succinate dehydrogenase / fumarate reductase membrane anchor subunit|nr:succinate dehydrogenase, hydrophobic membrane anchor protein [Pseudomonadales bacterium]
MVTNITSLGRNGLYDWLVQRVSAVVLLAWFVFVGLFIATHGDLQYGQWRDLFAQTWMRVFTLAALLSLCAHAWIGLWTVATDYLTKLALGAFATLARLGFLLIVFAVLLTYLVWAVQILWSI